MPTAAVRGRPTPRANCHESGAIATAAGQLPVGIVQFNNDVFANGTDLYATYTSQSDKEITVNGTRGRIASIESRNWPAATTARPAPRGPTRTRPRSGSRRATPPRVESSSTVPA